MSTRGSAEDRHVPVLRDRILELLSPALQRPVVHVNIGESVNRVPAGAFDHVAFRGVGDPEPLVERLKAEGIAHKTNVVANGIRQVFCSDPHGVNVEFNFPPA